MSNLADKELVEGPQKVLSRPSRRPLARLPQRGRFVLGPCNPSLGTAPQRRPSTWAGSWAAARCQRYPPGVHAPSPRTRCGVPGVISTGRFGHPLRGRDEVQSPRLYPFRKWAVSHRPHLVRLTLIALAKADTCTGKGS